MLQMNTVLFSLAAQGLNAELIKIEVDHYRGHPGTVVVGLGDAAVQESKERVRAAIKNTGYSYPRGKVVVNLAPADIRKSGPCYDLPIALGMLTLQRDFLEELCQQSLFLGELSLDGSLRPIQGVLSLAAEAKQKGFTKFFVPLANANEAALIPDIQVFGLESLRQAVDVLTGNLELTPQSMPNVVEMSRMQSTQIPVDFAQIKGQQLARRALEIAAAGGHNVLLNGSPGSGKTLMAQALAGILPAMTPQEVLDVTKMWSLSGLLSEEEYLVTQRPFRVVHHTASGAALVGGGSQPKPGEISLAHRGVLFLDEMAEFPRRTLELLRQPLEDHRITISRAQRSLTYPAQFLLCGAMNPCPCGYYGVDESAHRCDCHPAAVQRYQKKVSGPLLDRIDITCLVSPLKFYELDDASDAESSSEIRKRVEAARRIQVERFTHEGIFMNAEMSSRHIKRWCPLANDGKLVLEKAVDRLQLSARSYHRLLKVSRTIADLDTSPAIQKKHVLEALQYRRMNG